MKYKIFIGIDQTGAVDSKGKPKPLPVCLIDARQKKIIIKANLYIQSFNYSEIYELLNNSIDNFKHEKVLICIDSVIGLPEELNISPKQLLKTIQNFNWQKKAYGALVAFHFFNGFLKNKPILYRQIEKKISANSVFKLKPYQRNIGCGSYRMLKDLSQDPKWYSIWPFEKIISQYTLAEGYPSFYWKNLLKIKSRNLDELKKIFPFLHFKNLDEADSFLLAFAAYQYQKQIFLKIPNKSISKEGWVLGVDY